MFVVHLSSLQIMDFVLSINSAFPSDSFQVSLDPPWLANLQMFAVT